VRRAQRAGQIITGIYPAFCSYFGVCRLPVALDQGRGASYFRRTWKAVWLSVRKAEMMNWETPSFEEIDMSAEIGSYQGEDDNGL
jgi:coenzyme PQQ precursor peptide PqqA